MSANLPLSESFYVIDNLSRAEELAGQIEKNFVGRKSIFEILRRKYLEIVTFGQFNELFRCILLLDVHNDTVDLRGLGIRRIVSVSIEDLAAIEDGDDGVFNECQSWEAFLRFRRNTGRDLSRHYYQALGDKVLHLAQGRGLTAQNKVHTVYDATPYVGWTLQEIDADNASGSPSIRPDIPDILVPLAEMATALEATQQSTNKEGLAQLANDFQAGLERIGSNMLVNSDRRAAKNQD